MNKQILCRGWTSAHEISNAFLCTVSFLFLFASAFAAHGQRADPVYTEFLERHPTPLLQAIAKGDIAKVRAEINHGESVNAPAGTVAEKNPILLAANVGKIEIVKILIENKADVNATGPYGDTPLLYASTSKNLELVKLLLSSGANPNAVTSKMSESVVLLAAQMSNLEILLELVAAGGDIKVPDAGGANALMRSGGDEKIVRYLLVRGFDLEDSDDEGLTALHYAVQNAQPIKLRLLLEAGIKRDTKTNDGRSATDLAATIQDKEKRQEILAILASEK